MYEVFNRTFTGHYFSLSQTLYDALFFVYVLLDMLLTQRHLLALTEGTVLRAPLNVRPVPCSRLIHLLVAHKRSPLLVV